MKKYWIHYYRDFANCYNLFWTDSQEMEAELPEGAEQITKKQAFIKCRQENDRRRYDHSFSGYADSHIFPAGDDCACYDGSRDYYLSGYIWERSKINK